MIEPREALLIPAGIIHAAFDDDDGNLHIIWNPDVWAVPDYEFPPGVELIKLAEDTIESVYDHEQYHPHDIPDFDPAYVYRRMVTGWVKAQQRTDD